MHLNRNPRKFKMADMQLSSEEIVTTSEWHYETLEKSAKQTIDGNEMTKNLIASEKLHTEITLQKLSNGQLVNNEPTSEVILLQKEILNGNTTNGNDMHDVNGIHCEMNGEKKNVQELNSMHLNENKNQIVEITEVPSSPIETIDVKNEAVPTRIETIELKDADIETDKINEIQNSSVEPIDTIIEADQSQIPSDEVQNSAENFNSFSNVEVKNATSPVIVTERKERPIEVLIVCSIF